ncbi:MAG: acyltransferase [Gammaproteobacteria bacterium]|nr:acyltransferase [Gammaproteobacteria bacterium]
MTEQSRVNNFDFLRFLAASLVLFSHSFRVSYRNGGDEPLSILTHGQATFGSLAVAVFFVISGFLITMSYENSTSGMQFVVKRGLRIFPALFIAIILTSFVLGPVVTRLSIPEYLMHPLTYTYLSNISLVHMQWELPGVFEEQPWEKIVNASLWTLYYELLCYIAVLALGILRLLRWQTVLGIFLLCLFVTVVDHDWRGVSLLWRLNDLFAAIKPPSGTAAPYAELGAYFASGSLIYLLRSSVPLNGVFALICICILAIAARVGGFTQAFILFGGYVTVYLAFSKWLSASGFAGYGDFSYGIYIYAFPIQQAVCQFFMPDITWQITFFVSYPVIFVCAYFSWHLIEKPSLSRKRIFQRTSMQNEASAGQGG